MVWAEQKSLQVFQVERGLIQGIRDFHGHWNVEISIFRKSWSAEVSAATPRGGIPRALPRRAGSCDWWFNSLWYQKGWFSGWYPQTSAKCSRACKQLPLGHNDFSSSVFQSPSRASLWQNGPRAQNWKGLWEKQFQDFPLSGWGEDVAELITDSLSLHRALTDLYSLTHSFNEWLMRTCYTPESALVLVKFL